MDKPNVVLLFPDQWRGDCLGQFGHPVVETPFLDDLAQGGITFPRAYTPCPSCIAARASLITGRTPESVGRIGYRDGVPWKYENTLMDCLQREGCQSIMVGKTHFFPQRAMLGFEQLHLYEVITQDWDAPSDYHIWLKEQTNGLVRDTAEEMNSNGWVVHPWTHPEPLHPTAWTVTRAIETLEARDKSRPFFLKLGFHRPHPPLDPPLAYFDRFAARALPELPVGGWAEADDVAVKRIDHSVGRLPQHLIDRARAAYYAQLAHIDFHIGRLIRYLQNGRGLLDNTWIIFTSDHGEMLGDHHRFRKVVPFEGSARIPFIIRPPRAFQGPRGVTSEALVTLYDIMPTILEASGIAIPKEVEGKSILPVMAGGKEWDREFLHGEHSPCWHFVTDGRAKFAWNSDTGREWFFDLEADPQELHNLADDAARAAKVKVWRDRLIAVLAERPEDGLSDGRALISGKTIGAVRSRLLEN